MKKLSIAICSSLLVLGACTDSTPPSPNGSPSASVPPPVATSKVVSDPAQKPVFNALRARGFHPAETSTDEAGTRIEKWTKNAPGGNGNTFVKVSFPDEQPVLAAIGFAPVEGVRAIVTNDMNVSWNVFACGIGISTAAIDEATITSHLKSAEDNLEGKKSAFEKDKNPALGQRRANSIALLGYAGCEIAIVE